eukprot:6341899-Pyramimonas_sp.AAC.1
MMSKRFTSVTSVPRRKEITIVLGTCSQHQTRNQHQHSHRRRRRHDSIVATRSKQTKVQGQRSRRGPCLSPESAGGGDAKRTCGSLLLG